MRKIPIHVNYLAAKTSPRKKGSNGVANYARVSTMCSNRKIRREWRKMLDQNHVEVTPSNVSGETARLVKKGSTRWQANLYEQ